jgi:hypothetical protein
MMRKGVNELQNQPSISNLFSVDLHSFIEREELLTELEISRELGISIGQVRHLKKNFLK